MNTTSYLYATSFIFLGCIYAIYWGVMRPNHTVTIMKFLRWSIGGVIVLGLSLHFIFPNFSDPTRWLNSGALAGAFYLASLILERVSKDRAKPA